MGKHLELEIKTLQNAPRDADKLRRLLEVKQRQKEEVPTTTLDRYFISNKIVER